MNEREKRNKKNDGNIELLMHVLVGIVLNVRFLSKSKAVEILRPEVVTWSSLAAVHLKAGPVKVTLDSLTSSSG